MRMNIVLVNLLTYYCLLLSPQLPLTHIALLLEGIADQLVGDLLGAVALWSGVAVGGLWLGVRIALWSRLCPE